MPLPSQAEAALLAIDGQELVARLAAVRDTVSGKVANAEGVTAVRAALVATFERIVVGVPENMPVGRPILNRSGLVLTPIPRAELLEPTPVRVRLSEGSLAELELP